jgi:ubiquinol-cytochrome c reductase iron-sulfur subunit
MSEETHDPKKRSFLNLATGAMIACGAGATAWTAVKQMSPSADVEPPLEVTFLELKEGEQKSFNWRGKPYILRHRTAAEMASTRNLDLNALRDKFARNDNLPESAWATLENRTFGPDGRYTLMAPICTHLGCIVLENDGTARELNQPLAYLCPCHAAKFDSLGFVYGGPAPSNLAIPKYSIRQDRVLVFGTDLDFQNS